MKPTTRIYGLADRFYWGTKVAGTTSTSPDGLNAKSIPIVLIPMLTATLLFTIEIYIMPRLVMHAIIFTKRI